MVSSASILRNIIVILQGAMIDKFCENRSPLLGGGHCWLFTMLSSVLCCQRSHAFFQGQAQVAWPQEVLFLHKGHHVVTENALGKAMVFADFIKHESWRLYVEETEM
mmetsp:Transcript_36804/g.53932  ORF Transcript_36804/g.53932 Transcript_36804/m.53932 type:complete len:107 (+) Transcript_36804:133-453(+)